MKGFGRIVQNRKGLDKNISFILVPEHPSKSFRYRGFARELHRVKRKENRGQRLSVEQVQSVFVPNPSSIIMIHQHTWILRAMSMLKRIVK
jgi:hypothetical protein